MGAGRPHGRLDDIEAGVIQSCLVRENSDLDLRRGTGAVGVIVQRAGGFVVNDAVECIFSCFPEMKRIIPEWPAHPADVLQHRVFQVEDVLPRPEVHDLIDIRPPPWRCVEDEDVLAGGAGQRVVSGPTKQLVVAVAALQTIVAGFSAQGFVQGAAHKDIVKPGAAHVFKV